MKNFAIRSFVLVLAITGMGATMVTSSAKAANTSVSKNSVQVQSGVVCSPTPMCPPNDPNGCGID
jgi:hypothetical protein